MSKHLLHHFILACKTRPFPETGKAFLLLAQHFAARRGFALRLEDVAEQEQCMFRGHWLDSLEQKSGFCYIAQKHVKPPASAPIKMLCFDGEEVRYREGQHTLATARATHKPHLARLLRQYFGDLQERDSSWLQHFKQHAPPFFDRLTEHFRHQLQHGQPLRDAASQQLPILQKLVDPDFSAKLLPAFWATQGAFAHFLFYYDPSFQARFPHTQRIFPDFEHYGGPALQKEVDAWMEAWKIHLQQVVKDGASEYASLMSFAQILLALTEEQKPPLPFSHTLAQQSAFVEKEMESDGANKRRKPWFFSFYDKSAKDLSSTEGTKSENIFAPSYAHYLVQSWRQSQPKKTTEILWGKPWLLEAMEGKSPEKQGVQGRLFEKAATPSLETFQKALRQPPDYLAADLDEWIKNSHLGGRASKLLPQKLWEQLDVGLDVTLLKDQEKHVLGCLLWLLEKLPEAGSAFLLLPRAFYGQAIFQNFRDALENRFKSVEWRENLTMEGVLDNFEHAAFSKVALLLKGKRTDSKPSIKNPEKASDAAKGLFLYADASHAAPSLLRYFFKGIAVENETLTTDFDRERLGKKMAEISREESDSFVKLAARPFVYKWAALSKTEAKQVQEWEESTPYFWCFSPQAQPFYVWVDDSVPMRKFGNGCLFAPVKIRNEDGMSVANVSPNAFAYFQQHYQKLLKAQYASECDRVTAELHRNLGQVAEFSSSLPVLAKYSRQLQSDWEAAGARPSPEQLQPLVGHVETYQAKIHQLSRDARERKNLFNRLDLQLQQIRHSVTAYQRFEENLEEKKGQLTHENLIFYAFSLLYDAEFQEQHRYALELSVPFIPFQEDFWERAGKGRQLSEKLLSWRKQKPRSLDVNRPAQQVSPERIMPFWEEENQLVIDSDMSVSIPTSLLQQKIGEHFPIDWLLKGYKNRKMQQGTLAERFPKAYASPSAQQWLDMLGKIICLYTSK